MDLPVFAPPVVSSHPLEPLTAAEVAAAVRLLKDAGKVTPTTRFVSVSLKEPPKDVVHGFDGRRAAAARGVRRPLRQRHQHLLRGDARRSTDGKLLALRAHPRRAADDDDRRADRVRAGGAGQPGVQGRPQEALRHRRHAAWSWSISGAPATTAPRRTARGGWPGRCCFLRTRPDRQRLRPADRRACGRSSISTRCR